MIFTHEQTEDIIKLINNIEEFCKENDVRFSRITYDRSCRMIIFVFKKNGATARYYESDINIKNLVSLEDLENKIKERIKILTKE